MGLAYSHLSLNPLLSFHCEEYLYRNQKRGYIMNTPRSSPPLSSYVTNTAKVSVWCHKGLSHFLRILKTEEEKVVCLNNCVTSGVGGHKRTQGLKYKTKSTQKKELKPKTVTKNNRSDQDWKGLEKGCKRAGNSWKQLDTAESLVTGRACLRGDILATSRSGSAS